MVEVGIPYTTEILQQTIRPFPTQPILTPDKTAAVQTFKLLDIFPELEAVLLEAKLSVKQLEHIADTSVLAIRDTTHTADIQTSEIEKCLVEMDLDPSLACVLKRCSNSVYHNAKE